MKKRLLFVCQENTWRSPAAQKLFLDNKEYEAKSAGISPTAPTVISQELIEWADDIFVMEELQKNILENMFELEKEIIVLDIGTNFYGDELEYELREKLKNYIFSGSEL